MMRSVGIVQWRTGELRRIEMLWFPRFWLSDDGCAKCVFGEIIRYVYRIWSTFAYVAHIPSPTFC